MAEASVKKDINASREKVGKMLNPEPINMGDTHDAEMGDATHDWKAPDLMESATGGGGPPPGMGG